MDPGHLVSLPWLFVVVFGAPALIFAMLLLRSNARFRELERVGTWTEGIVVAIGEAQELGDRKGQGFRVMFVDFRDAHGRVHRIRSQGASSLFPGPGSHVRVLYDPARPEQAWIREDRETGALVLKILTLAFGAVALLALVAGVIEVIVVSLF